MDDRAVQSLALPHVELLELDGRAPASRRTTVEIAGEIVRALPSIAKMCARLLRDSRVPRRTKMLVGMAALYFVSPIDLLPEGLFPVVGWVDDLLMIAFALDRLMRSVDPVVLREHWDGDGDALDLAGTLISWVADMVPGPVRRLVDRWQSQVDPVQ